MTSGFTRRELLKVGAGAGAAAMLADPIIQSALAAAPKKGSLEDIEHVIILIQENRSFDHYFGMMPGVNGFANAVAGGVAAQPGYPAAGYGGVLMPFHMNTEGPTQCIPDITHDWGPQHESWDGGKMDGFVQAHLAHDGAAAAPATMGYYTRADVPLYWALAEAFTLCDAYHCSVMGPTDPNRLYSMSGTIDPDGVAGGPLVQTITGGREKYTGRFTWQTMPEALSDAGISWKVYDGSGLGISDNPLTFFKAYQENPELAANAFAPKWPNDFEADLAGGTLPQVSWINASLGESEHAAYSTAKVGEHAVSNLLKKLWRARGTWEKTALFITWDENGGFYDHVVPPTAPEGTPGEYLTVPDISGDSAGITGPIGLGFRVPMIVVSPYTRGGFLSSETYDHTSTLRFLERRFGVTLPTISDWRRENTGDLTDAFNFAAGSVKRPKLPHVAINKNEREHGGCAKEEPVTVPPNSTPEQPAGGSWKTPSGVV